MIIKSNFNQNLYKLMKKNNFRYLNILLINKYGKIEKNQNSQKLLKFQEMQENT